MTHRFLKLIRFFCLFIIFCVSSGCEQKEAGTENEVLLRVGDRVLTVLEFNKAFEIAETAYTHNIRQQSDELRKAKARLLNQLTIEMVFLERAEELEITVTDAELQKAVSAIKSDYPEGEFEKSLLEAAVTYDSWGNRLKTRLIMEKVIEQELENPLTITPEDIADYYQENYQGKEMTPEAGEPSDEISEVIVNQLRRKKAEEAYQTWIKDLTNKYAIEINSEQWEKISGSKSIHEDEMPNADSESG
jgi:hypothetical protein